MSEVKKELKEYTTEEIAKHTADDDCWMIIGNENNGT
jgi:cytochrome b involved in lipid metabolism